MTPWFFWFDNFFKTEDKTPKPKVKQMRTGKFIRRVPPSEPTFSVGDKVELNYTETTGKYGEKLYTVSVCEIGEIIKIVDLKWYLISIETRICDGVTSHPHTQGLIAISIVNHPNLNPMKLREIDNG